MARCLCSSYPEMHQYATDFRAVDEVRRDNFIAETEQ
jgi:hypothetical protein